MTRLTFLLTLHLLAANVLASDILVSSRFSNSILRYDGGSGAFLGVFASGGPLLNPNGIVFGPDGLLYAGLGDSGVVLRYDGMSGEFVDRFIESVDFEGARGMAFGADGDLYVAAGSRDRILRFDGETAALLGTAATDVDLDGPVGLDLRADGLMAVGSALGNALHLYRDGVLLRRCRDPQLHGTITGVMFGRDGAVYAATSGRNSILRFDPENCAVTQFASGGGLNGAVYMEKDADGNLLAGSFLNDSVVKFDGVTGAPLGVLVSSGSGGLDGTHDIAVVPVADFRTRLFLPGVARTEGNAGSFFRTTVWMTNPANEEARLRLRYHPGAGFQSAGAIEPEPLTIPPRGMLVWDDVLDDLFQVQGTTTGVLLIETTDGSPVPLVSARTFNDTGSATYGQYIEAVPPAQGAGQHWLHGLAADAANRTNLGIVNFGETAAPVLLTLWNPAGTQIGATVEREIPAGSSMQFGATAAAGLQEVADFSARVTCTGCAVYASRLDNITSDPVYIVPGAPRTRQWIDGVSATTGAGGTLWHSTLSLANRGGEENEVTVAYTPRGATLPSKLVHLMLAPLQTRFFTDLLPQLLELTGSGAIEISSQHPVSAWTRTFNDRGAEGTLGQFIPAFGAEDLIGPGGAILQGLTENEAFRTNAGLLNTAEEGASVLVECRDGGGALLASKSYAVAGGGTLFIGRILADLGVAPVENVYLHVRASAPDSVYAWASSVENASTDQIFIRPRNVDAEPE